MEVPQYGGELSVKKHNYGPWKDIRLVRSVMEQRKKKTSTRTRGRVEWALIV